MQGNDKLSNYQKLKSYAQQCNQCKLAITRNQVVFGEGNIDADIMFIGEGPGKQEDLTGHPFVGRAGILLTDMLKTHMNMERSDVYIANIVKCRPSIDLLMQKDRPPQADEVEACKTLLFQQINIIQPKIIITLGGPSTKFILQTQVAISSIRGTWHKFQAIDVMPTFHPSYLLRNGGENSNVYQHVVDDMNMVLKHLQY